MNPIDVLVVYAKSGFKKGKSLTDGHVSSGSSGLECVKRSMNDSEQIFQRNRHIFKTSSLKYRSYFLPTFISISAQPGQELPCNALFNSSAASKMQMVPWLNLLELLKTTMAPEICTTVVFGMIFRPESLITCVFLIHI